MLLLLMALAVIFSLLPRPAPAAVIPIADPMQPGLPATQRIEPGTPALVRYGTSNDKRAVAPQSDIVSGATVTPIRNVLHIPLLVQEALPAGVTGLTRLREPVTVGVPLPENGGFKSESQFGLKGSAVAQFRTLARWPNGNVKWLLVDFQSSVEAGTTTEVVLTEGRGNFGGELLATDSGSTISVDTGKARFVVRKARFRLFDSVQMAGMELLKPGQAGLIMTDPDNNEYRSIYDNESKAVIEENGPARAVVKAVGALKSKEGRRLADYSIRLHFYKNKSLVKGEVSIRNARKAFPSALYFQSMEIILPTSIVEPAVTFSNKATSVSGSLKLGETAHVFQGYSRDKSSYVTRGCAVWDPPVPASCEKGRYVFASSAAGLEIIIGAEHLNRLGADSDWTSGWAFLQDRSGRRGIAVAMPWMSAYWPADITVAGNGNFSIGIFSRRNSKRALKLEFGKIEGREIAWDFGGEPTSAKRALYMLQYPLVARAPFNQYRQTRAIYGQAEFPTVEEQGQFFLDQGKPQLAKFANAPFNSVIRAWPWRLAGGDNQIDFPLGDLQDFLRTGFGGFYVRGRQRTVFNAHAAIPYSDDFHLETGFEIADPNGKQLSINGPFFDAEHAHMMSLPLYYFLSGDERAREAILEYGEHLDRGQILRHFSIPGTPYLRAWSRHYRNIALIFEFICYIDKCNDRYRTYIEAATNALLDSRDKPQLGVKSPSGRNLERGYLYWDTTLLPTQKERVVHSFFHTQIHFEAVWQAMRILRDTQTGYLRLRDMEDYLHGLALFFLREYYDAGDEVSGPGIAYNYPLDRSYVSPLKLSAYGMSRAALVAYINTGNVRHLEDGKKLISRTMQYSNLRHVSELQEQALIASHYRRPAAWQNLNISVERNGSKYILRWPPVTPGSRIEIRYSRKPIVEWLGFDKVTRRYEHSPDRFTPYFAAARIDLPDADRGQLEVTALACDRGCNFAAKYLPETN